MMFVLSESSKDLPIHFAMQKVFGMTDIRNHTVFNKQSKLLNGKLTLPPIRKKNNTLKCEYTNNRWENTDSIALLLC